MKVSKNNLQTCLKLLDSVYNITSSQFSFNTSKRYLWTDAFGVCNFINMFYETKEEKYLEHGKDLIQIVHNTLGKDRSLTVRLGNATDECPTRGGLRIGKENEEHEEDGDGQYFHYVTKWAFALNRMSIAANNSMYNDWAVDLIKSVHPYFVSKKTRKIRMYWKISIDRSRPLVNSQGNLDPFDGYVTYRLIQQKAQSNILEKEIEDMGSMVMNLYSNYHSLDPLDLGEALWICHWFSDEDWSKHIGLKSLELLGILWDLGYFRERKNKRLAFREFGTSLGLQVSKDIFWSDEVWEKRVDYIHQQWNELALQRDRDITPNMYCSSLFPGVWSKGFVF